MKDTSFGLVHSSLLEKIDGLFACNAGDYVDLPQLVVVGNQSSGKSSVLVALTSLPFPRDSGLCTRFATQIIFRRSNRSIMTVSIIPAKDSSTEHQEKMRAWGKKEMTELDSVSFAAVMAEVTEVMGFGSAEGHVSRAFSKDVLVIEIASPSQEHFSIIDVPGTFKRTTSGVTNKDDMALVDEMVHEYMANPRSVMLAVVPCNVDIANQDIIEHAEDLDPGGDRTFGVLTKPDLVDRGAERSVIDLIEGKQQKLKLGWHLLRNPGQAELLDSSKSRQSIEQEFFNSVAPWNKLDKDKIGIQSLRIRLQEILARHIRREFPKVKNEITERLKRVNELHKSLGPKRQTQFEQREFLVDIAAKFQDIVSFAIRADYSRTDFFNENDSLRLATATVNRGEKFSDCMAKFGHEMEFKVAGNINQITSLDGADLSPRSSPYEQPSTNTAREFENTTREFEIHPDIEDIIPDIAEIPSPQDEDIFEWLKSVYWRSRGFELGTFDSSLIATTMKHQAQRWRNITLGYISDVITLVHSFVVELLEHIVPDSNHSHLREGVTSLLFDELRGRYENALKHTEFLLSVELEGIPATYNHYFKDTLDKSRQQRLQAQLTKKSFSDSLHGNVVRVEDIVQNHPHSNDDHIILEIHDILRSYYELARKRFVDNVRMQVADHFLVTGPDTPLKLFSPKFVAAMTSEDLEEVAGEEPGVKRQRAELQKEMRRLEEGRRILR